MGQKSVPVKEPAEQVVKAIRRATRRQVSAEEKIRIVLSGLRGEDSIAELCRREGIVQNLYRWSKEFLEAGKSAWPATPHARRPRQGQGSTPGGECAEGSGGRTDAREPAAEKTYGPPRPQEACASRSDRSASTYPVSELPLRPRWSSRALVLISAAASMRHFFHQGSRAPVQPSGHLAFTTHRFQQPPAPDGCLAAELLYAVAGWSLIVAL